MRATKRLLQRLSPAGALLLPALTLFGCADAECAPGLRRNTAGGCDAVVTRDAGPAAVGSDGGVPMEDGGPARVDAGPVRVDAGPVRVDAGPSCVPEDDPIDTMGLDTNCDGVDGVAEESVFVSATGSDMATGTPEAPVQTISAAVELAAREGKTQVLVAAGTYQEAVVLRDGVSIYGGYQPGMGWTRSGRSRLEATGPVISGEDLPATIFLASLEVVAADAARGESSIAMALTNAEDVILVDSIVEAGEGGAGADGRDGDTGQPGGRGGNGEDSDGGETAGGAGGAGCYTFCDSGRGGNGGGPYFPTTDGVGRGYFDVTVDECVYTQTADSGTDDRHFGADGEDATSGSAGTAGSQGEAAGMFSGTSYEVASGTDGRVGAAGDPGVGGGGGFGCAYPNPSGGVWPLVEGGGAGGGGGGSGCGGTGGGAGQGGGASIAVVLYASNLQAEDSELRARGGGRGGDGGIGGAGGRGGAGGSGGRATQVECSRSGDLVAAGGDGGTGGDGGDGGAGGGGGGGPSFGVVTLYRGTFNAPNGDVTFDLGPGGAGGQTPGGADAPAGEVAEVTEGSPFV